MEKYYGYKEIELKNFEIKNKLMNFEMEFGRLCLIRNNSKVKSVLEINDKYLRVVKMNRDRTMLLHLPKTDITGAWIKRSKNGMECIIIETENIALIIRIYEVPEEESYYNYLLK